MSEEPLTPMHTFAAAGNLLVDRLIAEVHRAFAAASIQAILLKGPAIAGWLYDEDEVRAYGDGDFLVPRWEWEAAGAVLRELGFQEDIAGLEHPHLESFASFPWVRQTSGAGAQSIDLHATLAGIDADFSVVWPTFSADAVTMTVAGHRLQILGEPARAMHVALHAAHHHEGKALLDLRRALERLDGGMWERARSVAESLDAIPAFATGLRLTPAGNALARRLGVHDARSVAATLKVAEVPLAEGLERLANTSGMASKSRLLWKELMPSADFLRWWSPALAGRGKLGLAGAYAWRLGWLIARLPRGFLIWRKVRREGRRH